MNAARLCLVAPMLMTSAAAANDAVCTRELTQYRVQTWQSDDGLQQILLNLVANARDAMPDGGRIIIELKAHAKPGHARLTVRDTGTGIDEATRNRIFEPFFTTKQAGKGTGLGLAVTHGIVDGAGGWIDIESGRGAGTAFHVILPVRRH